MKTVKYRCSLFTMGILFFISCSINASSLVINTENSPITIPFAQGTINIDGDLNDNLWQEAAVIDLNLVNYPFDNQPSPVTTTAKIVENGEYLYISFLANDPEPSKIQGFLGDRDTKFDDDLVGIKLDTQNNRRMNYEFMANPYGVQNDSINNVNTGEVNDLWDGIWQSAGKITAEGYQVEMAIPFRILNFQDSNSAKTWAMELFRIYPRDPWLRISHVPLDRDNLCKLCQYPEIIGFANAKTSKNLMLTPTVVAIKNQTRDPYEDHAPWQTDNKIEAGLDIRWGINSNTLFNATINPDFSSIEADAGQIDINKNFSLFYNEKRPFFLENIEYFSSNFDLVYTRNIANPDFGAKLTSSNNQHTYAAFISNDTQTNFLLPGNLSSDIATLNTRNETAAFKYRYDYDASWSMGLISTLRHSENYHNYTLGVDTKYSLNESNNFFAQLVASDTLYPEDFYLDYCLIDGGCENTAISCAFRDCAYTEQVHRAQKTDNFNGTALSLRYQHQSEFWKINAKHQSIAKNFRADLGFMPKVDIKTSSVQVDRLFYGDNNSLWQEGSIAGLWSIEHSQSGELIDKTSSAIFKIDGPWQSHYQVTLVNADKVGLRLDESNLAIDGNTDRFNEKYLEAFGSIRLSTSLTYDLTITYGDKIDYTNNRLGDFHEFNSYLSWFPTAHLEIEINHIHNELDHNNDFVYKANLIDTRFSYQFNLHSYLKLSVVYQDIKRNELNQNMIRNFISSPYEDFQAQEKELITQLIYSYKINPQTVFYLGYSDNSYQDDYIDNFKRNKRTFFSKISYAFIR